MSLTDISYRPGVDVFQQDPKKLIPSICAYAEGYMHQSTYQLHIQHLASV